MSSSPRPTERFRLLLLPLLGSYCGAALMGAGLYMWLSPERAFEVLPISLEGYAANFVVAGLIISVAASVMLMRRKRQFAAEDAAGTRSD